MEKGDRGCPCGPDGGHDRRRRVSDPARRSSFTSSRTACSQPPTPKMAITIWGSMQCPYYVSIKLCIKPFDVAARKASASSRCRNRRRLWRQGRISVRPGRARRAAGLEVGPSGEDRFTIAPRIWSPPPSAILRERASAPPSPAMVKPARSLDIEFVIDGGAYATLIRRGAFARHHSCRRPLRRVPTSASAASAMATNMSARMEPFAVSARPKASSRWSAISIEVARKWWGIAPEELRRRNFLHEGGGHGYRPDYTRECRSARPDGPRLGESLITTPSASGSPRKINLARSAKASASRPSCTARASPVLANAT